MSQRNIDDSSSENIEPRFREDKTLPALPWYTRLMSCLKRGCKYIVHWWWAWEILAMAVSIAATIALVVVLSKADNKGQQSWTFGSAELTLNTIVAGISTVIRAALLVTVAGSLNQSVWNRFASKRNQNGYPGRPLKDMDIFGNAATDSWSSLRLLWRTRCLNLAALGAVITVLSLAFDAFTQQVLSIETRPVGNSTETSADSNIFLPRASKFSGAVLPALNQDIPDAKLSVKGTIMSSIISKNVSVPGATCPTGNCTWPLTPTIGICSKCDDIRKSLIVQDNTDFGVGNVTFVVDPAEDEVLSRETVTLAIRGGGGSNISTTYSVRDLDLFAPNGSDAGQLTVSKYFVVGVPPTQYQNFIVHFGGREDPINATILSPMVSAYKCSLNFCLQTYNAKMTGGKMTQQPVGSWDQLTSIKRPLTSDDYHFTDAPSSLNISNSSQYLIEGYSFRALNRAFLPIVTGPVTYFSGTLSLTYGGIESFAGIGAFTQAFYEAMNSTDTMSTLAKQMADGLTSYIRTTMQADPDPAYAPAISKDEIFVRVRWPWLVFPLGLLIASQIFFAATMLQTRRRRVRPWKNRRLPLLLADIDQTVRNMGRGGLGTKEGLEERVGRMMVRLEFDEKDEIVFKRT